MTQDVAVIGMGRMGAAMARRLAEVGWNVTVHNRTADKAAAVADEIGGKVAATAREAAEAAPVVVSSLADDAAVDAVYRGPDGLIAGAGNATIVLETSTIDPRTVHDIAPEVERAGGVLLDTPVSGSVPAVQAGSLMIMVGGKAEALVRARPVLDALGSRIFLVGDAGAGATMKLAVNAIVHALNMALSEALVLAERAGIDRERAYEVFLNSAAAAPYLQYKQAAFERPGEGPIAFSVELMAKDFALILALAEQVGSAMPQAGFNLQITRAAMEAGLGGADMSAIAEHLRTNPAQPTGQTGRQS